MQQLRVGIGLDGLLCNTQSLFEEWRSRFQVDTDSFYSPKFIRNESFWMALKPYPDVKEGLRDLTLSRIPVYVLTERPKTLLPITRAWLRIAGLPEAQIVCQTIKRYDCRVLGLTAMLDSDLEMLKTFVYDETDPIYVDRDGNGGILNGRIKNEDYFDEAVDAWLAAVNL